MFLNLLKDSKENFKDFDSFKNFLENTLKFKIWNNELNLQKIKFKNKELDIYDLFCFITKDSYTIIATHKDLIKTKKLLLQFGKKYIFQQFPPHKNKESFEIKFRQFARRFFPKKFREIIKNKNWKNFKPLKPFYYDWKIKFFNPKHPNGIPNWNFIKHHHFFSDLYTDFFMKCLML